MSSLPLRQHESQTPPPLPPLRLWRGDSDERPENFGIPFVQAAPLLVVACFLFAFTSYPTVEGWGLWTAWNKEGANHFLSHFSDHAERPLHLLPSLVAWLIPGDFAVGSMAVGGILALVRGQLLITLSRLTRMTRGSSWFLFIIGLMQPIWPGCAYERFQAAQTAFVCLLGTLTLTAWYEQEKKWWVIPLTWLTTLAGFMTYQGLFLVALATPLPFLLFGKKKTAINLGLTLYPGCFLYIAWYLIATKYFPATYIGIHSENTLSPRIFSRLWGALSHNTRPNQIILLLAFLLCLGKTRQIAAGNTKLAIFLLFAFAPVTGIIFYKNLNWLGDPERVMLPCLAWILVLVASMGWNEEIDSEPTPKRTGLALALICLLSLYSPYRAITHIQMQQSVLSCLKSVPIEWNENTRVLLLDRSGKLGRLYTFLAPHHLNFAWKAMGNPGIFTIQTAKGPEPTNPSNGSNQTPQGAANGEFTHIFIIQETGSRFSPYFEWKITFS